MFTGIVEEIGTIRSVTKDSKRFVLDIGCSKVLEGTKEGDSIAVNGVCLTVTTLHMGGFTADVMPETAHRSNISRMSGGTRVNLERAMAADGRFGGHIVSGHVDGACFRVSIIPHTRAVTILGARKPGDIVNLENDIIGKYVEKLMKPMETKKTDSGITEAFLLENGF